MSIEPLDRCDVCLERATLRRLSPSEREDLARLLGEDGLAVDTAVCEDCSEDILGKKCNDDTELRGG